MKHFIAIYTLLFLCGQLNAQKGFETFSIVVDKEGNGDFKTIQAALNSLEDSAVFARTIFIKNGIYNEKLYIEKHNIHLKGESREGVVITQAIARDEWRCGHTDDWGVATMNVDGDDITLQNLTVVNSFGFDFSEPKTIPCKSDTVTGIKVIGKNSHQMALRTLNGNRLRAINCHFKAFGGDTVSPWDVDKGMFYFKDCIMEGGVDFYCPRGWAWAENCRFIVHSGTAAIWHDGDRHKDSKTVLKNCTFEGFDGFALGRFHRDAQFYLINCTFPQNMADKDIYLVTTNNIIKWGKRVYYYNSHRTGGDYAWHKDNLHTAEGNPSAADITPQWVFDGRWFPELESPKVHARLRKKNADGNYGQLLQKEVMPMHHPANDFTKVAVPFYQTEGPAWENNKVGFRLYLDVRNGKDIFGKTTAAMVMDTVGTKGDVGYHHLDEAWGMDILKVGKSLGAGALALQIKNAQLDTLVRLGGTAVQQTAFELVKDGPTEAVLRINYNNWKVLDRTYNLVEEISIQPDAYYYQSKVTINGLKGDERLVTGIVNLNTKTSYKMTQSGKTILYTHDQQSENKDFLGMGIMVENKYQPQTGKTPNVASDILNTYTMAMNVKNNQPVVFRFYAAWEKTDPRFKNQKYFKTLLQSEAAKWNTL